MLHSAPLMKRITLLLVAALAALALAFSSPSPAEAKQCIPVPFHPCAPKCNSGSGNDSEINPVTLTDCDPGNSAGNNQGGD